MKSNHVFFAPEDVINNDFFGKSYSEAEFFPSKIFDGCLMVNIEYVNGIFFIS